jgi:hypothetical protein
VSIARSIARPIASPIASRTPIIGGGLVPFYLTVNGSTGTTTVDAGESVVIAVVERASFPDGSPTYEWLFNGVTIDGETLDELDLGEVGESDAGEYECIVTAGDRTFRASITLLVRVWILSGGQWSDTSVWNDSESWIDA